MMCIGMFMAILDVQVVATSLPAIQGALGIARDQMSWIQTAYLIVEVIAIPLTGALIGTPASMSASVPEQTLAMLEEPLDSKISETSRTV